MYKIEKTDYGFFLTFGGTIDVDEMRAWYKESEKILAEMSEPFQVFVDMRTLIPIRERAVEIISDGQRLYKKRGMVRSVVITSSPVTSMQFKGVAFNTSIDKGERYIDAQTESNWKDIGLAWILEGIEPPTPLAVSNHNK